MNNTNLITTAGASQDLTELSRSGLGNQALPEGIRLKRSHTSPTTL